MNRREFLKLGGLASALLSFSFPFSLMSFLNFPVETSAFGKIFRGYRNGDIYVSEDQGITWQMQYRLGSSYSIMRMFTGSNGKLYLQTAYHSGSFHLTLSPNGRAWISEPETMFL